VEWAGGAEEKKTLTPPKKQLETKPALDSKTRVLKPRGRENQMQTNRMGVDSSKPLAGKKSFDGEKNRKKKLDSKKLGGMISGG